MRFVRLAADGGNVGKKRPNQGVEFRQALQTRGGGGSGSSSSSRRGVCVCECVLAETVMAGWTKVWGAPQGDGVIISQATWWRRVKLNLGVGTMDELEDVSEPGSVRQCGEGRGYLVTRSNPGRRRVATGRSWWMGAADRRLLREMGLGRWRGQRWQKAVKSDDLCALESCDSSGADGRVGAQ